MIGNCTFNVRHIVYDVPRYANMTVIMLIQFHARIHNSLWPNIFLEHKSNSEFFFSLLCLCHIKKKDKKWNRVYRSTNLTDAHVKSIEWTCVAWNGVENSQHIFQWMKSIAILCAHRVFVHCCSWVDSLAFLSCEWIKWDSVCLLVFIRCKQWSLLLSSSSSYVV